MRQVQEPTMKIDASNRVNEWPPPRPIARPQWEVLHEVDGWWCEDQPLAPPQGEPRRARSLLRSALVACPRGTRGGAMCASCPRFVNFVPRPGGDGLILRRSEEHTSELH